MSAGAANIIARDASVVDADYGDACVLFHPVNGVYCDIDETGARIWALLEQPRPLGELVTALAAQYKVEPERCRDDTLAFLESLKDGGFVTISEA